MNNTISIKDVMNAYETVRLIKEEIVKMEERAKEHYRAANEHHDTGDTRKSNLERTAGNAIMEAVIELKRVIG